MTPFEALPILATIGKRLQGAEQEAFREAYRALAKPLEAQLETVRQLRPNARVCVQVAEPDAEFGAWSAWIIWRDEGPHEYAEIGSTAQEALTRLKEALERAPKPKSVVDVADEAEERKAIETEPRARQ